MSVPADRLTENGRYIDFRIANAEASDQIVEWVNDERPAHVSPRTGELDDLKGTARAGVSRRATPRRSHDRASRPHRPHRRTRGLTFRRIRPDKEPGSIVGADAGRSPRRVPQDDAAAVKWLRSAAEPSPGDADAQANLGVMCQFGYGVVQDDAAAVKWYRLAGEQGFAIA